MATVQAGGIILWRKRIVLRRTLRGEWVFPKGWIDPGETPEQAAVREVREETGVEVQVVGVAGSASYEMDGETREVVYYLMRGTGGPGWAEHAGIDAASFPPEEIEQVLTFENNRDVWRRASGAVRALMRSHQGSRRTSA